MIPLALVVARARDGVIGREGGLPWRLKTDLQRFKAITLGKPVIMGRKTWESLPRRPLPGRTNLVLTRDGGYEAAGALVCADLTEALGLARDQAADDGPGADGTAEVCLIGGAGLFAQALPKARRLYLTEVEAEVAGDVTLPGFPGDGWRELRREEVPAGPEDDYPSVFRVLVRG